MPPRRNFPVRQVMGKGIPDIATERQAGGGVDGNLDSTGSSPKPKRARTPALLLGEALGNGDQTSAALPLEKSCRKDAAVGSVDGVTSEDGIDKRIHALDCARRLMAVAGATAAAACSGDAGATEAGAAQLASRGRYDTCL